MSELLATIELPLAPDESVLLTAEGLQVSVSGNLHGDGGVALTNRRLIVYKKGKGNSWVYSYTSLAGLGEFHYHDFRRVEYWIIPFQGSTPVLTMSAKDAEVRGRQLSALLTQALLTLGRRDRADDTVTPIASHE